MLISRWRHLLCRRSYLIPEVSSSTAVMVMAESSSTIPYRASFHSTNMLSDKWKKKGSSEGKVPDRERLSKSQIKYTVREKRADAKKALNRLLFHSGGLRHSLQDEWNSGQPKKDKPRNKSKPGLGNKSREKKTKRWHRQGGGQAHEFDGEGMFEATFGNNTYSWSFKQASRSSPSSGFEWREGWSWTNQKRGESLGDKSNDQSWSVGSRSDREILGLPVFGPLKLEDVKNAFRVAALKWHPDKHQGPSQETAEEKFKLCVNAYKSLCSALSS